MFKLIVIVVSNYEMYLKTLFLVNFLKISNDISSQIFVCNFYTPRKQGLGGI